jgi:hypothetical protein
MKNIWIEGLLNGKTAVRTSEPEFVRSKEAQELISPAYVAWRTGTETLSPYL